MRGQTLYIASSQFRIHHIIVDTCQAYGFEPDIKFETSGFSLCHKLVSQNKGISVTVDFISDDLTQKYLVLVPFHDLHARWEPCMLIRKHEDITPDIEAFRKHIKKWIASGRR